MLKERTFPTLGYGCAVVSVGLAIAVRLALDPLLGNGYPYATVFLAVLVTAWFGGFGAALAAVVLGGFASEYFLLVPRGSFSLVGMDQQVGMGLYAFTGLGISMLGGAMRAAQQRAEMNAEAARRKAALIDHTYDALLAWELHGEIIFWNRGAERLYGIPQAGALKRVSHELLRTRTEGGVEGFVSALERDGFWEGELEHSSGGNGRIIVESRMTLVREERAAYVVEVNRDITKRKETEAALREAKKQLEARVLERTAELEQASELLRESGALLRTVTDTAGVGMVIVDEMHRYRYANRAYAEILNLSQSTLVGMRVADVLAPVYETQIRPQLERAFQGERVSYELLVPPIASGARERFYAVSYEPGTDHSGKIVVVVIADITALKGAEAKLRESLQETVELKAALNEHRGRHRRGGPDHGGE